MLQPLTWGGDHDGLKARHHVGIDSQGNPAHARLGSLVVWNDDEIAPPSGFPMHAHRDIEIVTYVRVRAFICQFTTEVSMTRQKLLGSVMLRALAIAIAVPGAAVYAADLGQLRSAQPDQLAISYGRAGGLTGSDRMMHLQVEGGPPVAVTYDRDVQARTGMPLDRPDRSPVTVVWDQAVAERTNMGLAKDASPTTSASVQPGREAN
jgi:hypothetical protein